MYEIRETETYRKWRKKLKDVKARALIKQGILRIEHGLGDIEPVGEGVSELRIHYGPGYRLYFMRQGKEVILLLCGGNKKTQDRDIKKAKQLAKEWRNQ